MVEKQINEEEYKADLPTDYERIVEEENIPELELLPDEIKAMEKANVKEETISESIAEPVVEAQAKLSKEEFIEEIKEMAESEARLGAKELKHNEQSGWKRNVLKTKLVGVTFGDRQKYISMLKESDTLLIIPELENTHSEHAVAIRDEKYNHLGYIKDSYGADFIEGMSKGIRYTAKVAAVTGGDKGKEFGCNIVIYKLDVENELLHLPSKIFSLQNRLARLKTKHEEEKLNLKNLSDSMYKCRYIMRLLVNDKPKNKFSNEHEVYQKLRNDVESSRFEITMQTNELDFQTNMLRSFRSVASIMSSERNEHL